jgi:glucuronide carrier protein
LTHQPLPSRQPTHRLAAFAAGDFGLNLLWQGIALYLLFYQTERLGLSLALASAAFAAASAWDGIASFALGVWLDRRGSAAGWRLLLGWGAVPLALAFVLAWLPPPVEGAAGVAWVLGGQLLFRTAYAAVGLAYAAMSVRVSGDSRDRALVAGLRMLAGTLAAVTVALGTAPLGYLPAAMLSAALAAAILIDVAWHWRPADLPPADPPAAVGAALAGVARNRAFLTLAAAMAAMIVATALLGASVLYYFKYGLGDEAGGRLALAAMMASSAAALPLWTLLARRIGGRGAWFAASALALALIGWFVAAGPGSAGTQTFLIGVQVATVGLHFAFWALLPDTIEWGQRATGLRLEGTVIGLVTLVQRAAAGLAAAVFGWVVEIAPGGAMLGELRLTLALLPAALLAAGVAAMLANPLHRGAHARVLKDLTRSG